ncbi:MAG: hypothetical protein J6M62_03575 [Selenomonadaceae bacterium]|nr:hypothetical protein [Selenomonadaceae bacterium]MBO6304146.1 hypothetical protein [Selenomonadaceae bacterium]
MNFNFDLQYFAEEEVIENDTQEVSAEETTDKEEIPPELEGISEDVARDIMAKAQKQEEEKQDEEAAASQESDNIPEGLSHQSHIPYARFKKQVDRTNELKAQLAAYQQRYGDINAVGAEQAQQPIQQPIQPTQQTQDIQPQILQTQSPTLQTERLSPNVAKRIKEAINLRAKEISGLSDEDIDAIEYMDEGDERIDQWKSASEMAKNEVYGAIQKAQVERVQAAKAFLEEHQRSVNSFNAYTQKEQQNADFKAISEYAVDDKSGYAAKLSDEEKSILQGAYARAQRQTASPQDYFLVRNYFEQAKADFYNKRGAKPKATSAPPKAHPRSENITGATDPGGVTEEQLRTMLRNKKWDEIPQPYKDMMLGAPT